MSSSSVHRWSSDAGLNHLQKILWMILNWVNNHWFPNWSDSNLSIGYFNPVVSNYSWGEAYETMTSPSRTLAKVFMLQLPWQEIKDELGDIHVLDIGCGSGNNGLRLQSWSGDIISSYLGIDLKRHSNWKEVSSVLSNSSFIRTNVSNIAECFRVETNFIFSQSSIEHLEDDIKLFHDIHVFVKKNTKPIIQVHLLPSAVGLGLYRWHGVRQYTPRTVSILTKIFYDCSYACLFPLGGKRCNTAHISLRRFHQMSNLEGECTTMVQDQYSDRVRTAIISDAKERQARPSFYALVIHSNWSRRIY